MLDSVLENILIMILTIVFLLGGGYLFLVLLGWGLKFKSKNSEHDGLTDLWVESQIQVTSDPQIKKKADSQN